MIGSYMERHGVNFAKELEAENVALGLIVTS